MNVALVHTHLIKFEVDIVRKASLRRRHCHSAELQKKRGDDQMESKKKSYAFSILCKMQKKREGREQRVGGKKT